MMGRLNHDQWQYFYSFRLDEAVPGDHAVRDIAAVLDLSWVYSELEPFYPKIGRPSIDPVLIIRMLIIGYVFAIRSERALCRDVQVNLVIVDAEASRAIRQAEVGTAKTMIDRTEERFGLKPKRLAADSAYGSAPTLDWLVNNKKIEPHIPVIDMERRQDGTFARDDFTYDKVRDVYTCPAGKVLTTTGRIRYDDMRPYRLGQRFHGSNHIRQPRRACRTRCG